MAKNEYPPLFYDAWATAWGPIGAAAGAQGICRLILPHYAMKDLLEVLAWEHPGAVRDPKPFERLTLLSRDYFNGRRVSFEEVPCHLPSEGAFSGKVLRACRGLEYGQTASYSSLAGRIGREDAARAVATALSKNNIPLVVPCHRVTYADGRPGGFSAPAGVPLKQRMLTLESAE